MESRRTLQLRVKRLQESNEYLVERCNELEHVKGNVGPSSAALYIKRIDDLKAEIKRLNAQVGGPQTRYCSHCGRSFKDADGRPLEGTGHCQCGRRQIVVDTTDPEPVTFRQWVFKKGLFHDCLTWPELADQLAQYIEWRLDR